MDEGVDLLEAELHKRAFEGVERPVLQRGAVGTWRFYSDALASVPVEGAPARRGTGARQVRRPKALTPGGAGRGGRKGEEGSGSAGLPGDVRAGLGGEPGRARPESGRVGTGLPANTGAGRLNVSDSESDSESSQAPFSFYPVEARLGGRRMRKQATVARTNTMPMA